MTLDALRSRWKGEAEFLRRNAGDVQATVIERLVAELEVELRREAEAELTLAEAAALSGYSPERLRHMVAEGKIANAGRKHAPRIRRGDLPKKAAKGTVFDPDAMARRTVNRGRKP